MRSLNIINSTIRSDARSFAATLTTSFLACWLLVGGAALAQDAEFEPLSEAELATLVGPIALYPDDVLAVVLPASTYPLQIGRCVAQLPRDRPTDERRPRLDLGAR
jgi:hypothetical protein